MHGQGTLSLKNGQSFSGEWIDGVLEAHKIDIAKQQKKWQDKLD